MMLSEHFSLEELTLSQQAARTRLDNTPSAEILFVMTHVLVPGLELVRTVLGNPIIISSGYRSPAVNAIIGGARDSQHMRGQAADFVCPKFGTPFEVCRLLQKRKEAVMYDQLIHEFGRWAHISFVRGIPRGEELTASLVNGKTVYAAGINRFFRDLDEDEKA